MVENETGRLNEVRNYLELNLSGNPELQDIVDLAAQLCEKPVALITLLDQESNWLKVRHGTDIEVMPSETSFCQYTIKYNGLFIVPDTQKDELFRSNPLVMAAPGLRFYAGAPLILGSGYKIGTLCLFDVKPNHITQLQQKILTILARQATFLMELEMSRRQLESQIAEKDAKSHALMKIAQLQSHQVRQPLTTIMGLVDLVNNGYHPVNDEWMEMFKTATDDFDKKIHEIVAESMASKDIRDIRFHKMVEEIDDYAILLLDTNGNIENWNRGAEKIKLYRANEIIGKHFSVFYIADDQKKQRPQRILREARNSGVARDEGWRVRKGGSKFWGRIIVTAIYNDNGEVIGYTKVTRDLTDITDTRDALLASEELYEYMVLQSNDTAHIGGWELNVESNNLSWTSVTKAIHGVDDAYTPDLERAINFYKAGYSREAITRAVNLAIKEGTPWDLELQIVTNQGKEIWVRAIGRSNYKDGVCTKVYGTFQDIDAIKRDKIELLRSKKLFEDVLNAPIDIGIIVTDINGTITNFNNAAEKLLGYEAHEVVGKHNPGLFLSFSEIMQRSKELGVEVDGFESLIKVWDVDRPEQRTWTYIRKDRTEILVPTIVTPLRDTDNRIYGYVGIATIPV